MKKATIVLGLAMAVVLGVTSVYAGGPGFGPGKGPRKSAGGMGAASLTSEQQTKMQELRLQHRNEVAPLRDKMIGLRQELRALWSDPKADPAAIQAKAREMKELRDQMQDERLHARLEGRNLLTPEQIQGLGAGFGQGPGRGRGHGRGRL
jgi:periplasmic protein CpxP/Spy